MPVSLLIVTLFLAQALLVASFHPSFKNGPLRRSFSNSRLAEAPGADDKLIFDTKEVRLYEAELEDDAVGEFCLVDPETGKKLLLTKEEKERIFLDSIQSYYFSGKNNLDDEQFDQLREDLSWEGSALVNLNRDETRFLNAVVAYSKGEPIMSDQEFDKLKTSLRDANSIVAVSTEPKCYVDTGVCKVTWLPDPVRTYSLYVPAALFFGLLYLGLSYEITFGYVNPIILLILGVYPIYRVTREVTDNFLFKTPLVAAGPCPSCGVVNKIFFGDVLGVEGNNDESTLKCTNCKTRLTVKRDTLRVSTLNDKPEGPPPKPAAKPVGAATA